MQRLLEAGHGHGEAVEDVLAVEAGLVLLQDRLEVGGPVPDLVIRVHLAPGEQHQHVGQQIVAQRAEPGESGHGRGAHGGVLEQHAVVDEADVARGVGGAGPLLAQQREDLHGKAGMLAVLDELAKMRQAVLLGLGVLLDDRDDGVGNASLVVKTSLVPQHAGQEVQ